MPRLPLDETVLAARCEYWQRVLRLQDWDVRLDIARMADLGVGTLGECDPSAVKRQAKITLLDERDLGPQKFWFDGESWDWEITLVHELLHLHLHDVVGKDYQTPAGLAAERAIHAISKALVALERAKGA